MLFLFKLDITKKRVEMAAKKTKKKTVKPKKKTASIRKKTIKKKTKASRSVSNGPEGQNSAQPRTGREDPKKILDQYDFKAENMPINVKVYVAEGEFVPIYHVSIASISKNTETILEQIRKKLIREVNLGMSEITNTKDHNVVEDKFKETISVLVDRFFPDIPQDTKGYLTTYLVQKSLGMGNIEILMHDDYIEEIVINDAEDPVWIYHKKHAWLKTNVMIQTEEQTRHYSTMIGRKVGRQISVLEPLLDAHLNEGDRVNATIMPISTAGNTMTIRKFSRDPFTITHFLKYNTLSLEAAALIWLSMQYELSAIIAGGTASGKTSTLNVLATFFPPNQRIISIEDTREIRLPKFLHWVPLNTRQPNSEGRGEVSMEHLLVNSLRMRPDRILVGEVRRRTEAETLFEAIHTGHSCYATFHANNAEETINRLTNPPIEVPKTMMPAISLVIIQFRNRRTGKRRTFQLAEVLPSGEINILMQYEPKKDTLVKANKSKALYKTLQLYTGFTEKELNKDIKEKVEILKYLIRNDISTVDGVGRVMAEYYTDKANLIKATKKNIILR